ncbi:hypothetical protein PENSPDRAFT_211890 [Peniophora sp. CONT]|nr:hypothetical protein PENSPDRAFT_211890 [Peniophora sp. CONT]
MPNTLNLDLASSCPYVRLRTMASSPNERDITVPQDIISGPGQTSQLRVKTVHEHFLTVIHIADLLASRPSGDEPAVARTLGVAPVFFSKKLDALAFATSTQVLVVFVDRTQQGADGSRVNMKGKTGKNKRRGRALLENLLLGRDISGLESSVAIDARALAVSLHVDIGLRVARCVDVLALCPKNTSSRTPALPLQALLSKKTSHVECSQEHLADLFTMRKEEGGQAHTPGSLDKPLSDGALRAWLSLAVATVLVQNNAHALENAQVTDTSETTKQELDSLSRIMVEGQQKHAQSQLLDGDRKSTRTSALAEAKRGRGVAVGSALDDTSTLHGLPFVRALHGGEDANSDVLWEDAPALPEYPSTSTIEAFEEAGMISLNETQKTLLGRALSCRDQDRLLIAQGGIGTGKTTLIAAICMAATPSQPVWVLSQTNATLWSTAARLLQSGIDHLKLVAGTKSETQV